MLIDYRISSIDLIHETLVPGARKSQYIATNEKRERIAFVFLEKFVFQGNNPHR